MLQPPTTPLSKNDDTPGVINLRNYLTYFGHIVPNPGQFNGSTVFDAELEGALARFQKRHGLPVTGQLDINTLALMQQPRCGVPDRRIQMLGVGNPWKTKSLSYRFGAITSDIPAAQVRSAVAGAMQKWAAVTGLSFTETSGAADIVVLFGSGAHGDATAFDGPGGVLAHAYYPPPNGGDIAGDCHFDDDETWTDQSPQPSGTIDLPTVALHELGHSLGLDHSSDTSAVMYAYYGGERRNLHTDDVTRIRALYGRPIALQAHNGQYVCAEGGGGKEVVANRDWIREWETFGLIELDSNRIALRAFNGQFVVAEGGGGREVLANRDAIGPWEIFNVVRLGGLQVALQASNGNYVCAEGGGGREVVANRTAINVWETFTMISI